MEQLKVEEESWTKTKNSQAKSEGINKMEITVTIDTFWGIVECPFHGEYNQCQAINSDANFCPTSIENEDGIYSYEIPRNCPLQRNIITVSLPPI